MNYLERAQEVLKKIKPVSTVLLLMALVSLAWCAEMPQNKSEDELLHERKIAEAQSWARAAQAKIDACITITAEASGDIAKYHKEAEVNRAWLRVYGYTGDDSGDKVPGLKTTPEIFFARCFNEAGEEQNTTVIKWEYDYHTDCTNGINGNCYRIKAHPERGDCAVKDTLEGLDAFINNEPSTDQ